jgi:hypothetical protein
MHQPGRFAAAHAAAVVTQKSVVGLALLDAEGFELQPAVVVFPVAGGKEFQKARFEITVGDSRLFAQLKAQGT